jgi:hypothetical protein
MEIATESGKIVIVPDEGRLTGPLVDYTAEISGDRFRVLVPRHYIADHLKRAEVILISKTSAYDFESIGEVISQTGRFVLADPHMLYKRMFGDRWVRPDELARALRALNRRHRVGSSYPTDTGETAVAVRVSSGASRYEISETKDGFEMKAKVFHGDD